MCFLGRESNTIASGRWVKQKVSFGKGSNKHLFKKLADNCSVILLDLSS